MTMYTQRFRTARTAKHCADCGRQIAAGDRFLDCTLSPRAEFNDTDSWGHAAFCGLCSDGATENPPRAVPQEEPTR